MPLELKGYKVFEEIYHSERSLLYKAQRRDSSTPLAIKTIASAHPASHELASLKYEQEMLNLFDFPGIIRFIEVQKTGNNLAIVMEHGGISMADNLNDRGELPLKQFFDISIQIIEAIGEIHNKNIIHKDINPDNIVINPKTGRIKIIDFGISSRLSREKQELDIANKLEGSLPYISPEQTGRMNRDLDYRTDFYSLGITFFKILTNNFPLIGKDIMGWVYAHLSQKPRSLNEFREDIPPALDDIVRKLVAKNPEDRYQSAYGLLSDLRLCREKYNEKGEIPLFIVGREDISARFQIPQGIIGREKEKEILLNAFESAAEGHSELLFVSGFSGVGKSALVNEIHKPVVEKTGYFIDGKFDQFQKDIPYKALTEAFTCLMNILLTEKEEKLENWREHIFKALKDNAGIITALIPMLEKVIGKQTTVQELGPQETENRFIYTFKQFVTVFTRKNHPLVIFLDDLQWSDHATFRLLEEILLDGDIKYLYIIGAFRSNEVDETHPLSSTISKIKKDKSISEIHLAPLRKEHVNTIVARTLHCDEKTAEAPTKMVYQKTVGNPFFVNELLRAIFKKKGFNFNQEKGRWEINIDKIKETRITDNVVDILSVRLETLPRETKEIIKIASCIGNQFDLNTLSMVTAESTFKTARSLESAILDELIIPLNERCRVVHLEAELEENMNEVIYMFQHDKVRQAAYSLVGTEDRKKIHLKTGRNLLKNSSKEMLNEKIIDIVRQLNEGIDLIADQHEKDKLARLNLQAGRKAMASTAYKPSLEYMKVARGLLPNIPGEKYNDLFVDIYRNLAESYYLNTRFEEGNKTVEFLLSHVKTNLEKAEILSIQIPHYTIAGKLKESIDIGLTALFLLGIRLKNNHLSILIELIKAKINLKGRKIAEIVNAPDLNDPGLKIVMKVIKEILTPTYLLGDDNLFGLLALRMTNISLKYGNSPEASLAYAAYAIVLRGGFSSYKNSYEYASLALKLAEKFKNKIHSAKVYFVYTAFAHSWNNHINTCRDIYQKSHAFGIATGDILYTNFPLVRMICDHSYSRIDDAYLISKKNIEIIGKSKDYQNLLYSKIQASLFYNFFGRTDGRLSIDSNIFNEKKALEDLTKRNDLTGFGQFYTKKLEVQFTYEDATEIFRTIKNGDKTIKALKGLTDTIKYCFYSFMAHSLLVPRQTGKTRKRLNKEYKKMKQWCDSNDINLKHLLLIMEAEFCRLKGKVPETVNKYKQAIDLAEEREFFEYKALGKKLLAKYYISSGKRTMAIHYMSEAYCDYEIWGAKRICEFLKEKYGEYIQDLTEKTKAFQQQI